MTRAQIRTAAVAVALGAALASCGTTSKLTSTTPTSSTSPSPASATGAAPPAGNLPGAEHPSTAQFPSAGGRTLMQLSALASSQAQLGAATGVFTPGTRRVAFGLNQSSGAFVYGPTALYLARTPNSPAQGPFLAPADPLGVAPQFRSQQNAGPGEIQAIYAASLPVPRAGTYTILALTHSGRDLIGAPGEIAVARSSGVPDVGQRPPAIATDTPASVGGHTALLTTRIPADDMHSVSFRDVLGKRPVALLFSTPQLCMSRVCGPVTDIALALEHQFGGHVAFIHEEVYVNNQPKQGLRPQLKAFHLETEPWLFTINRRGKIVARLEGAFGVNEFTRAIQAALS